MRKIIATLLIALLFVPVARAAYVSFAFSSDILPSSVEPGEKTNIILRITNIGNLPARNVVVSVDPNTNYRADQSVYDLQTIAAGGVAQISVPMTISSQAAEGPLAVFFTINYYEGESAGLYQAQNSVSLLVTKRTLIEIENVSYDKELIERGDSVELSMLLSNVGKGRVKDLTVALSAAGLPFVPASGETEFYIGTLDSGQSAEASFNLIINQDAKTTAYSIPVVLTYFDESGMVHTKEKTVGIKVSGIPEFILTLERQEGLYAGNTGTLTISIANRGTADANFLAVKFDPNFYTVPSEYYVGNLESDGFQTITFDIDLGRADVGKNTANLELRYKDPYNKEFTENASIEFSVLGGRPVEVPLALQAVIVIGTIVLLYWKRNSILRFARMIKIEKK